jgi:argininosuccinate lyase
MAEQQLAGKMWSGRFREPLDPAFEQWQRSFPFDWRLLAQEVAASKAHARMIAAAGVLSKAELAAMLGGLDRVLANAATDGPAIVASAPGAEDIHHFVELRLTAEIGDLALKLHTGRSRNEQIATDMRLFVREAIDATVGGCAYGVRRCWSWRSARAMR